ncbi:protein FAR1-RELATED SEQUENCE 7-like isoform X2 [Gastrolobium bilobum]|uniref:protein FAR1-RELATED SEQUENCE 7-like isoform X1 n=1 Tax=Gastrolobium bilobum TaxID=150636 RepID=UPI002AAF26DB|nr:protein FAR1-RELATED SEQUENCE 7-like isoform X1 [Gastrolobium bilobum]XP_061349782.1 protein FAR1-RELATED SEQUENCE 7-like isoform X2 [Gastrolobium bilobum]
MIAKENPVGTELAMNNASGEEEIEYACEPYIGLEFDSADDALKFYTSYAKRTGFKVRIGQLYRSRTNGSVSSRRFVCSKEGYQLNSRTGCPAFVRVQRRESGKWVIDHFLKGHNHDLVAESENCTPTLQQKGATDINYSVNASRRQRKKLLEEADDEPSCPFGIINFKRLRKEGDQGKSRIEPYVGQVFSSANEAYQFYHAYAACVGFGIRFGQLFRSKNDGLITSRRFVCSKEGFQHPSRVGCGTYLRIKRQPSGKWVVDRLQKEHNHNLDPEKEGREKSLPASNILSEEVDAGLLNGKLFRIDNYPVPRVDRQNHIKSDWYTLLFEYFQSRQVEDTGFFYAVEVDNGKCMSIFWADGRSRFSCSQFGDVLVLDTFYRKSVYLVPFATFVGINHHKQPVLLGCALIADESEESFTWLFRTWLRATCGQQPLSIIADQDIAIQKAIAKVFPATHHRFSLWEIKAKEQENVGLMGNGFSNDFEKSIYQSQTVNEFDTAWNALLNKYGLKDNAWLKEMYEKRASWVPFYLRGTFFAGIPINESVDSFFGALLNAQTPIVEFISRYERGLERRREEERKEDFNTSNFQPMLQTKEPVEEQCRRLYTLTIFKVFQKELLQCYSYLGFKIYEEGGLSRYLVRRCGNDMEKHVVTFSVSNLSISCSCQMFEYEGILCRHALRVFQILELREVPSRYILHRWTKNADDGVFPDIEAWSSSQELRNLMLWSLRETASKYIDAGATSIEKYKLACEILREGGRKLCWPR